MVRRSPLHGEGCGFESYCDHQFYSAVSQLVVNCAVNTRYVGSNPTGGANYNRVGSSTVSEHSFVKRKCVGSNPTLPSNFIPR